MPGVIPEKQVCFNCCSCEYVFLQFKYSGHLISYFHVFTWFLSFFQRQLGKHPFDVVSSKAWSHTSMHWIIMLCYWFSWLSDCCCLCQLAAAAPVTHGAVAHAVITLLGGGWGGRWRNYSVGGTHGSLKWQQLEEHF